MGLSFLYESENSSEIPEAGLGPSNFWMNNPCGPKWLASPTSWGLACTWGLQSSPTTNPHLSSSVTKPKEVIWVSSAASAITAAQQCWLNALLSFGNFRFPIPTPLHYHKDWATYMNPDHRYGIYLWSRVFFFSICILWGVREKIPWCSSLFIVFPKKRRFVFLDFDLNIDSLFSCVILLLLANPFPR